MIHLLREDVRMNVTDEETAAIRSNDLSSAFLLVARFLEPSGPKLRGVVYREEFDRPTQSSFFFQNP